MRTRKHSLLQWFLVTVATVGISSPVMLAAQGQEVAAASRVLNRTYFKSVSNFLFFTTTPRNAFSITVVVCPGPTPCTIAVTVSSEFGLVTAGQVAGASVIVNRVLAHPGPVLMSRNESNMPQTATMTFLATNVPAGNRLVQVQFQASDGTGFAGFRSLEIAVYKP
jgi:hypothetical protein